MANAFLEGLRAGRYPLSELDDKVRRILRVIFACGMKDPQRKQGAQHPPEHLQVARRVAEEGVVLLQNKEGQLPWDAARIKTLAVIGDNAMRRHCQGGGSSGVKAVYEVTPWEGLQKKLGDRVRLVHTQGYPEAAKSLPQIPDAYLSTVDAGSGIKGWRVEWNNFHEFEGPTLAVEYRDKVSLRIQEGEFVHEGLRRDWWATRWTAELTVPETGRYTFALNTDFWGRLYLDDRELIAFKANKDLVLHQAEVELVQGQKLRLKIEYGHSTEEALLEFGWFLPGQVIPEPGESREAALALAREADAVLVVGGLNHFHDNEGMDRESYVLPGGQDELISEIAQVNANTVVLLIGGSAHAMPWAEQVKAIVLGGYAGSDAGTVFAELLFGGVNPSGKLTYTVARRLEDYPSRALDDYDKDICHYKEGVLVGYRWFDAKGIEPLFPFGHGLSYSSFEFLDPRVECEEEEIRVAVKLRNSGSREGKEVVQLYLEDVESSVPRPCRELKGFQKVELKPGEERELIFSLTRRDCSFWDEVTHAWKCEPGEFVAHLGNSSRHLPVRVKFKL
ncbi:MAG: hypothetical protein HC904_04050 [Blastochloris sp.]|nr:hypothetical protein [Blastochloris sp.]